MLPKRDEIATIVVCEDDEPTLELLCDHLTADRFGAMPAPSASDALRLCRYKQPDLLLLDLALPDASGLDVLREIRDSDGVASRFDPKLPVVVLTGRGSDADRVRGFEVGADDCVVNTKPVLPNPTESRGLGEDDPSPRGQKRECTAVAPLRGGGPPRRSGCTRLGAERSPVQIRPPR